MFDHLLAISSQVLRCWELSQRAYCRMSQRQRIPHPHTRYSLLHYMVAHCHANVMFSTALYIA